MNKCNIPTLEELKYFMVEHGALFVTTVSIGLMLRLWLFAGLSGTQFTTLNSAGIKNYVKILLCLNFATVMTNTITFRSTLFR
jgi:hypothetical protein